MKQYKFGLVLTLAMILSSACGYCNGVSVSGGMLADQSAADKTIKVQFDLTWQNSWRDAVNYDAAWIFVKFSVDSGNTWAHATLKTAGTNPSGFSTGSGTGVGILVPADKKGCFIQRADNGSGTVNVSGIKLVWDYNADGVADPDANSPSTRIKIFAIEMVYIPQGSFLAGDTNADRTGCFKAGALQNLPVSINSESAIIFNSADNGPYYYQSAGNPGEFASGAVFTLPSNFPKGFGAFYMMKYEISQGQWINFFNTLTAAQKTARDITSSSSGGKNSDAVVNRNAISFTSGEAVLVHSRENDRACNFLSWMDLAAFADWAALRPMTELEFEKSCRGAANVVNDEYAWGSITIAEATNISGTEDGTETVSNSGANSCFNDVTFTGGDGGSGPLRCGIFATASSTRQSSGAGFYGNMELSGNLWERAVSIGHEQGLNFIGTHGDGILTSSGNATNGDWPGIDSSPENGVTGASGSGFRGGGWYEATRSRLNVGDRSWAARTDANRSDPALNYWGYGGRCVRTAP